jgi:phosphatidylglycerophosphate synthase
VEQRGLWRRWRECSRFAGALTLARAWLVPIVEDSPTPLVCGLAALTDALDGPLARRCGATRAGRDLEGLVDACFELAALRGLTRTGRLGRGAALAESARLTAGVGYATFAYLGRAKAPEVRLVRAARSMTAVRFAGLLAAASGRRRRGRALLVSGSACSVALTARTARR